MFDEDQLREMSHPARHELMRMLAAIENADPAAHDTSPRRRALVLAMIVVCCVVLAAWIGVLVVTLPRTYRSGGWRGAWVGFDVALLAAFAVTGWAAWRRRQVLIICLVVLATLLCCDAWFDVVLDVRTSGFGLSVLSAVCIELPLAGLAILGARRLLRLSLAVIRRYEGETGEIPGLRQAKIVGGSPGSSLSGLFTEGDARGPGRGAARSAARASARGGSWPRPAADHGDRAGPSLGAASDHGDAGEEPGEHEAAERPAASREAGESPASFVAAERTAGSRGAVAHGGADAGGPEHGGAEYGEADGGGAEHGEADGGGAERRRG